MIDFDKIGTYLVALAVGIVYGIKVWDDLSRPSKNENGELKPQETKGNLWRRAIYSAFGSGIVCLLVAEGLIYYAELPHNLALLFGAMCGFAGADAFKEMFLRFIESKFHHHKGGGQNNG